MGRNNANKTEFFRKMLPQGNIFLTVMYNCKYSDLQLYTL